MISSRLVRWTHSPTPTSWSEAKKTLERAHDEAAAHHDPLAGVENIALALTAAGAGPMPPILSAA